MTDRILSVEDMGITSAIRGITPFDRQQEQKDGEAGAPGDSVFASIFKTAVQNVKETDAEFVNNQYLLATGQLDNPVQLGISAYKNEIAVDLLIQLRNRALDAYSELSRLSI